MVQHLLIILSSVLFVIPFLNFNFWPLSWVCFVPLFYLFKSSNLSSLKIGLVFGTIVTLIGTYWIPATIVNQTGADYTVSIVTHFFYAIYESLFYIIVFLLFKFVSTKNYNKSYKYCLFIFFYIVLENYFPRIFPYRLGNSQILFQESAQLISIFGLNILSILVLIGNIGIYEFFFAKRNKILIGFVLSIFIIFIYGNFAISKIIKLHSNRDKVSISIIQPNNSIENLIQLNNSIGHKPYLIIWPESSLDRIDMYPIRFKKYHEKKFQEIFSSNHQILFGAITGFWHSRQTPEYYANTAILFSKKNGDEYGFHETYNKNKLMIFGEYYPLKSLISKIIPIYETFVELKPGEITPIRSHIPIKYKNNEIWFPKFGVVICYEDLFETNSLILSNNNSHVLINITNDWWYGDTLASYQHLMLSIPRAIENRKYLLRSAQNGISAIISPTGEILKKIEKNKQGIINYNIELISSQYLPTFSKYHGYINAFYLLVLALLIFPLFSHKGRNGSD
tara:strand:+ start:1596 stop:3119 length:1524 start_codon:yes stop_codon:yes gene_type:complete